VVVVVGPVVVVVVVVVGVGLGVVAVVVVAAAAMSVLAVDVCGADPPPFWAVTMSRTVCPTSEGVSV
jgi:hypothetical protein